MLLLQGRLNMMVLVYVKLGRLSTNIINKGRVTSNNLCYVIVSRYRNIKYSYLYKMLLSSLLLPLREVILLALLAFRFFSASRFRMFSLLASKLVKFSLI